MTDRFDDELRAQLQQPGAAVPGSAAEVLAELRPAMRRARLKRSLAIGTATLSLLGVTSLGALAVIDSVAQEPNRVDVFDDGDVLPPPTPVSTTIDPVADRDESVADATVVAPASIVGTPTTAVVPTTDASASESTENDPTTTTATENTQASPPSTEAPPSAPSPEAGTTTSTTAPPTTTPPTTTAAPTTTAPTTTAAPPPSGRQTVGSDCGSITVSWVGDAVSLVSAQPAAGFSHEVKQAGPDEVEVDFDGGEAECEIEAWIENGSLRTDVENDDGQDDD